MRKQNVAIGVLAVVVAVLAAYVVDLHMQLRKIELNVWSLQVSSR